MNYSVAIQAKMAASMNQNHLIEKKVLIAGSQPSSFADGAKVHFHYKTQLANKEGTVLDDSRASHGDHHHDKPMEIIIGKKFKLEVWEACLQKMAVGEVAEFTVDKSLCLDYPQVAKSLRDIAHHKHPEHQHMCGMRSMQEKVGLGYNDLDELLAKPQDLVFTFELLRVDLPGQYEKDTWTMTDEEKQEHVPKLKERGNHLYMEKKYEKASDTYAKAIGLLEELMMKEKPHSEQWLELRSQKEPLLLNYSQCRLLLLDYYPVIEHTTTVLESSPENVKALYRRAKAHVGAWNPNEAINDFEKVMELDPSLANTVKKELRNIVELQSIKDEEDKQKLKGLFK